MKNQTSLYGSYLIFDVRESRYRSKKTSVPGFFLLQMSVLSVSDVIIPEERKVIKIWRQNQLVGIRKPTLVDKKSAMSKLKKDRHF